MTTLVSALCVLSRCFEQIMNAAQSANCSLSDLLRFEYKVVYVYSSGKCAEYIMEKVYLLLLC
jgi:hypothetical protein